ncbi:helix-turn-helix domain-containing protein [Devosia sp. YIM 151766]|uniref:helix-turn-helix domain-containing protein n=1 Tax=Devosia sp. YIM 151766 TaxID=3017325 RepID=UPI00255D1441|nr:helix-turn-helix domain-containing protein [Devosia sp. YIM 151766]WIY54132.1 helix-turn-helix domain-containing protein [Devosia sp. YIM 151766]
MAQTSYMNLMKAQARRVPVFGRVAPEKLTLADIIERGKKAKAALGIKAHYNIASVKSAAPPVQKAVAAAVAPAQLEPPIVIVVTQEQIDEADDRTPIIPMPSGKAILREVSEKHKVAMVDLLSTRRARAYVLARHEAMYRMRHETSMSYPQIGRRMGGRDHSTVMHGIRKHAERMEAAGL